MPYPTMTYDAAVDAVAIQFAPAPRETYPQTKQLTPQIRADFAGTVLFAFEILGASRLLPAEALRAMDTAVAELTLREAAKEAKREPTTLRSAIHAGKLAATKRGRDWFIARGALWTYLEALSPAGRPPRNTRAPHRKRVRPTDD